MNACRKFVYVMLLAAVPIVLGRTAFGQPGGAAPPPEMTTLTTRDGVQLRITYFPGAARKGTEKAKQTTPVVLLHDYKGTRAIFTPLALKLQAPGESTVDRPYFAAVTVDLRAHGESTKQLSPDGAVAELDAAKLSKEDFIAMARFDMEAVRSFLVDKNDAGELNLNKLCILGSGMGASVAANWALQDWTAPPLALGKQGQDVKALVLISPRWSYNGLTMQDAMRFLPLKKGVAWLLICGAEEQKYKTDLLRIQKQLERSHPVTDKSGGKQRSGLSVEEIPSSLQGDLLVSKLGEAVDAGIVRFLTENVASLQLPWTNRRNKLP